MTMKGTQQPMNIARRAYRQRRLRDAARMLPIVGAVLWILPLASAAPATATSGLYIMVVWILLILVAAGLAAGMRDDPEKPETASDRSPPA